MSVGVGSGVRVVVGDDEGDGEGAAEVIEDVVLVTTADPEVAVRCGPGAGAEQAPSATTTAAPSPAAYDLLHRRATGRRAQTTADGRGRRAGRALGIHRPYPGSRCRSERRAPARYVAGVSHRIPIVLDVDTGVDDACALLLAALHPSLDLKAVSCVGGNAPVDDVVRNTLKVLTAAGRTDVPVARGAERPLLESPVDARHVHGDDGMGDLGWPDSTLRADERNGVELLRDVCREARSGGTPLTLVPLAPMTNIALLLRTYPDVAQGIERILFMGGAAHAGNATASAEFNVFHDPEAAAIVLDAAAELDIEVTMYGLDVFYEPTITREQARELVAVGGRSAAELGGRLLDFQCDRFGTAAATIGDAGAVCAVIEPESLETHTLPIRVELAGAWSRGRTILDRRDWSGDLAHDPHGEPPTRVKVALGVDGPRYAALWRETLLGLAD